MALHGVARGTVDLDLIVSLKKESFQRAESALRTIGLVFRLPAKADEVFRFRKEYISNQMETCSSGHSGIPATRQVDIVITHDRSKIKVAKMKVRGVSIQVFSKTDLIEMKRESGRTQDLIDAKALEDLT